MGIKYAVNILAIAATLGLTWGCTDIQERKPELPSADVYDASLEDYSMDGGSSLTDTISFEDSDQSHVDSEVNETSEIFEDSDSSLEDQWEGYVLEVPEIQAEYWLRYDPQTETVVEIEPLELKYQELVVLYFFSIECVPCMQHIWEVDVLWQRYKDEGLVVIGVHEGSNYIERARIESKMKDKEVTFPIAVDKLDEEGGSITLDANGIWFFPTYFIVEKGELVSKLRSNFGKVVEEVEEYFGDSSGR